MQNTAGCILLLLLKKYSTTVLVFGVVDTKHAHTNAYCLLSTFKKIFLYYQKII